MAKTTKSQMVSAPGLRDNTSLNPEQSTIFPVDLNDDIIAESSRILDSKQENEPRPNTVIRRGSFFQNDSPIDEHNFFSPGLDEFILNSGKLLDDTNSDNAILEPPPQEEVKIEDEAIASNQDEELQLKVKTGQENKSTELLIHQDDLDNNNGFSDDDEFDSNCGPNLSKMGIVTIPRYYKSSNIHVKKNTHKNEFLDGIDLKKLQNTVDRNQYNQVVLRSQIGNDMFESGHYKKASDNNMRKISTSSLPNLPSMSSQQELRNQRRKRYLKTELQIWSLQRKFNMYSGAVSRLSSDPNDTILEHMEMLSRANSGDILSLTTSRYGDVDSWESVRSNKNKVMSLMGEKNKRLQNHKEAWKDFHNLGLSASEFNSEAEIESCNEGKCESKGSERKRLPQE